MSGFERVDLFLDRRPPPEEMSFFGVFLPVYQLVIEHVFHFLKLFMTGNRIFHNTLTRLPCGYVICLCFVITRLLEVIR